MAKQGVREEIIKMVVKEQINMVLGGYENSILDGHITEMPGHEELVQEVYQEVMNADVVETPIGMMKVKKDIRFFTKERIMAYIEKKVIKEGY